MRVFRFLVWYGGRGICPRSAPRWVVAAAMATLAWALAPTCQAREEACAPLKCLRADEGRPRIFATRGAITVCNPWRCAGVRLARPLGPVDLLCGHGWVEPYEPHGVCLVKFGDGFS